MTKRRYATTYCAECGQDVESGACNSLQARDCPHNTMHLNKVGFVPDTDAYYAFDPSSDDDSYR